MQNEVAGEGVDRHLTSGWGAFSPDWKQGR